MCAPGSLFDAPRDAQLMCAVLTPSCGALQSGDCSSHGAGAQLRVGSRMLSWTGMRTTVGNASVSLLACLAERVLPCCDCPVLSEAASAHARMYSPKHMTWEAVAAARRM